MTEEQLNNMINHGCTGNFDFWLDQHYEVSRLYPDIVNGRIELLFEDDPINLPFTYCPLCGKKLPV